MPAKTPFWICGVCGFNNKPHAFRRGDESQKKCEQCGADQSHQHATDIPPNGR